MDQEQQDRLRAPFPPDEIGKLPKVTCRECSNPRVECGKHQKAKCKVCDSYLTTAHIHLDFVGHAHLTERLLSVDPEWGWEPVASDEDGLPKFDQFGGLWIQLTVCGTTRKGYGHPDGKNGGDAVKETIGDALRNAAMRFGVALDLWKKEPADTTSPNSRLGEQRARQGQKATPGQPGGEQPRDQALRRARSERDSREPEPAGNVMDTVAQQVKPAGTEGDETDLVREAEKLAESGKLKVLLAKTQHAATMFGDDADVTKAVCGIYEKAVGQQNAA